MTCKYTMILLKNILNFLFSNLLFSNNAFAAFECLADYEPAKIMQVGPKLFSILPPYASFDPCNKSVELNIIKNSSDLVVLMHGGGGLSESQAKLAKALNNEGISTLFFDSFKMNKIHMDSRWWALNNTTGPKQRMLYHANIAAVKWLGKNFDTAHFNVHLYGVSSGATAALNISSNEDLNNLKTVMVEGGAAMGIGLPDKIIRPTFFIFGLEDNYGGKTIDEFMWNRVVDCSWNIEILNTPVGNAIDCNRYVNKKNKTESLDNYINRQKNNGYPISIKFYKDAGHDIFSGKIRRFIINSPSGNLFATLGANEDASNKVFIDIKSFINNK